MSLDPENVSIVSETHLENGHYSHPLAPVNFRSYFSTDAQQGLAAEMNGSPF